MTERLYYTDAYQTRFDARVIDTTDDGRRVYLDRTAFYPASGGQPSDRGTLSGIEVLDVVDEGDRIAHIVAGPVVSGAAEGSILWQRRFDMMQQHSGQHLLSAVFVELFGLETISVHMGEEVSTLDLKAPALTQAQVEQAEERANNVVFENRPMSVSFADAAEDLGLRKATAREGTIRVVSIDGLDRSACGGTHVRSTGEIGPILIRKLDKIRGSVRVEFVCGGRAVRRTRREFDALSRIAQQLSAPGEQAPDLVRSLQEAAKSAEKQIGKLESELARYQGRELYENTPPRGSEVRLLVRRQAAGSLDGLRPLAQSFCASSKAVFIGLVDQPPAILLASSEDAGLDCGALLKLELPKLQGRGGGTARMAQGSVPATASLETLVALVEQVV